MSPLTPKFQLPYPAPTDPADVPVDMQELALQSEIAFGNRRVYAKFIAGNPQLTSSTFVFWPDAVGVPITIPTWANIMVAHVTLSSTYVVSSTAVMEWGLQTALVMGYLDQLELRAAGQLTTIQSLTEANVTGIRGSTENLWMRSRRVSGTGAITTAGNLTYDVQFL